MADLELFEGQEAQRAQAVVVLHHNHLRQVQGGMRAAPLVRVKAKFTIKITTFVTKGSRIRRF